MYKLKPLGALGLLSRWLVHLVLHYTDEAQLHVAVCSCTFGTYIILCEILCSFLSQLSNVLWIASNKWSISTADQLVI
jgi:hypothetical protein